MRRSEILKIISLELDKMDVKYPICEVSLRPENINEICTHRSIMITGQFTEGDVVSLFAKFGEQNFSRSDVAIYTNVSELLASQLINSSKSALSHNWRGRLWKWEDIKNIADRKQFEEKILASYWRFIITQRDDEYFARYEISPAFYKPGFSAVGLPSFRQQIKDFLKYLNGLYERRDLDPKFDRIVCFARKEPNKSFQRCNPTFFAGQNFISYTELVQKIEELDEEHIVSQIESSIVSILNASV